MTIVKAKVQAGRVELAAPMDWPNGLEVEVRPVATPSSYDEDLMTPVEIAETLAAMRLLQPMKDSAELHEATEAMINERKRREKAEFVQHFDRLKQEWK